MSSVTQRGRAAPAPSSIVELEPLLLGDLPEGALDVLARALEADRPPIVDGHRARLDLGQVEDLVDQREQVGAGLVDRLARTRPACRRGCRATLSASCRDRISRLLSGVRSSCDMLARNCDLYLEVSASCSAFSSSSCLASSTSRFLRSTSAFCVGELARLLLELLVGLLQLLLLGLQLLGQALRLAQQLVGAHRRLDGGDDDAEALEQLVEEGELDLGERLERWPAR